eukprot:scaffold240797_cov35-Tisochrysis_lutea.AAC.4
MPWELRELLAQDQRILDGHTATLTQVGHHGVRGVTEQADASVAPLKVRRPVVEISLLDLVDGRVVEQQVHISCPLGKLLVAKPVDELLALYAHRSWWDVQECVPLNPAAAHVD